MSEAEAENNDELLAATAAYYANEWPFGDENDPELQSVIAALCTRAPVQRWFDLGSGPIGPLWMPFIRPQHAVLTDLNGEHLFYAKQRIGEIRAGRFLPIETRAAEQAAARCLDTPATKAWGNCDVEFASVDLEHLQVAPEGLAEADLVTAIGALGCLSTMDKLDEALFWLSKHLRQSWFVAAFWMGSYAQEPEKYAAWPHLYYGDCVSRVLTPSALTAAARRCFSRVAVDVIELGGGRQLCVAEMRNL